MELARGPGYLHTTLMMFFLPHVTTAHYSSKSMDWLGMRAHLVAESEGAGDCSRLGELRNKQLSA